ncbi:hypothetical protein EWM64_g7175 [Hericium alpestre]|uniref:Uncharacterized protein n=1 Tax=Hericium alpestre TaxID=135208 RepID=A0A4Y9ZQG4_9AGAM|nr:hypothetical protein EWM64_g7175 [Hericium alpestre]
MPCFAYPNPTSASPIPFSYERRHFTVKTVPDDFPYELVRDNGLQIHYFEFRGPGPPPNDLGHPGDVWLNVKPGEYNLYARMQSHWELWPGPRKAKKHMFAHPLVPGRYLWCTRKHVLWYTCDGIRKSASLQTRGEEEDFGRTRYRTVGPMERGGARNATTTNDNVSRLPLRTAEEAVAKIIETEEEERRQGREPPDARRRRPREGEGEGEASSSSRKRTRTDEDDLLSGEESQTPTPPTVQQPAEAHNLQHFISHPFPIQPAASTSSSSLSQALGPQPQPQPAIPSPQANYPPAGTVHRPPQHQAYPHPQPPPQTNAAPPTTPFTPSNQLTSPNVTPDRARLIEHELLRMRDEGRRLTEENRRLNQENARLGQENSRLTEENARFRVQAMATSNCPPELAAAVRESMNSTLGMRVNHILADAQEQRAARLEAERKLAELHEQLKKMTQAFQLPPSLSVADHSSLHTPGPSPRMSVSDA